MKTLLLALALIISASVTAEAMKDRSMPLGEVHQFGDSNVFESGHGVRTDTIGGVNVFTHGF
ncbi:MAG: hypothetical protein JSR85_07970 [Proteobacteria bacterium]|nr:hypothetical protein [Pseudomonadota bacterium]